MSTLLVYDIKRRSTTYNKTIVPLHFEKYVFTLIYLKKVH